MKEGRARKEEIVERVVRRLIELAPDLLERALVESGALEEITEGYQDGSGGRT